MKSCHVIISNRVSLVVILHTFASALCHLLRVLFFQPHHNSRPQRALPRTPWLLVLILAFQRKFFQGPAPHWWVWKPTRSITTTTLRDVLHLWFDLFQTRRLHPPCDDLPNLKTGDTWEAHNTSRQIKLVTVFDLYFQLNAKWSKDWWKMSKENNKTSKDKTLMHYQSHTNANIGERFYNWTKWLFITF